MEKQNIMNYLYIIAATPTNSQRRPYRCSRASQQGRRLLEQSGKKTLSSISIIIQEYDTASEAKS